jgi:NADPH-ferrihemoprotein reductase
MAARLPSRGVLLEQLSVKPPQSVADAAAILALSIASLAYLLRGIAWDKPGPYHHLWFEYPSAKAGGAAAAPKATRNISEKLEKSVS